MIATDTAQWRAIVEGVSASAAIKLMRRVSATGSAAPAKVGGCHRPLLAGYEDLLRELTPIVRRPGGHDLRAAPGIAAAPVSSSAMPAITRRLPASPADPGPGCRTLYDTRPTVSRPLAMRRSLMGAAISSAARRPADSSLVPRAGRARIAKSASTGEETAPCNDDVTC